MAEKLESYKFRNQGQIPRYPWDQWCDGGIWRIRRGVDFFGAVENFRSSIHNQAVKRGRKARTNREGDDTIVFQFFDRSPALERWENVRRVA